MNTVNGQTNQPKTLLEIGGIESKPGRLSESIEQRCPIPAIHSRKTACLSEGSRKKNVSSKKKGLTDSPCKEYSRYCNGKLNKRTKTK
jgi:hypothetical protein